MRLSRWGRPVNGDRRAMNGGKLAMAAVSAIGIGVLAGCTGSGSSTGSSATASSNSATAPAASATVTAPSSTIAFVPITEPFDPGHPAHTIQGGPTDCPSQQTTLTMTRCYEDIAETQDASTDAAQQARFASATAAQQAAINAADQAWLAARGTVCAKAYHTGGTIDQVNIASCLADESLERFYVVKNFEQPEAVLKVTDSQNPSDMSWYSTPDGSRIGLVDTQGDTTGGVIIAWTVIAGASGFVVHPAQFYYDDGYFKDAGIVERPHPAGHRVAPGTEYTFSIDYSAIPHDPYRALGAGGFVYASPMTGAVWR
jgi:uncharacterized protein YecT (DUF1311 family)